MTLQTKDVVTVLQEDDSVILNCTYHKESTEDIANNNIRWQKQIENAFKDIAMFSPPGAKKPFIVKDMQPVYSNRTELIAPNTSLSAVVIIKDPVCGDGGTYRCRIEYVSDSSEKNQTSRTVVEFDCKYIFIIYANIYLLKQFTRKNNFKINFNIFENLNCKEHFKAN